MGVPRSHPALATPADKRSHTVSIDRGCPGRHFALRALFLNIACTLAVFDITEPVGEKLDGKYHEVFFRYATVFDSSSVTLAPLHRWADLRPQAPSPVQVCDQAPFSNCIEVG